MTDRLPRITAAQIIRVLEKAGFALVRQSGSHRIYKNDEGRRVTVAFHAGKVLHPRILKAIVKDAGLHDRQLRDLL